MEIITKYENILNSKDDAIVNPVNCKGVMGAGLAKEIKERYPKAYSDYRILCKNERIRPGIVTYTEENGKYILAFPTKDHWKDPSKMEYIESGLESLVEVIKRLQLTSIAIPALGCGLGGLEWCNVRKKIEMVLTHHFSDKPITISLYEPKYVEIIKQ